MLFWVPATGIPQVILSLNLFQLLDLRLQILAPKHIGAAKDAAGSPGLGRGQCMLVDHDLQQSPRR
jgi:hypothetical protein